MLTLSFHGRSSSARRQIFALTTAAFFALQPLLFAFPSTAAGQIKGKSLATRPERIGTPPLVPSATIVISQIYGGGGNSGSTFTNDFIELFNRGTSPTSLNGWSVQYASAGGTTWSVTNLTNVTLQPGQHYLVQEAAGAGGTTPLPTPDASGNIAMSSSAGKVALVNTTTALTGSGCPIGATVVDFVGYGTGTTCSETAATPAPSNTTAVLRLANGCTETDNNSADFATGAPNPRNTAAAFTPCGGGEVAPSVSSTIPTDNATGVAQNTNLQIVFSEAVNVGVTWFQIVCGTSGTRNVSDTVVTTGDNTTFSINPNSDFAAGETCTVTVDATQVTDQDANDPPDNMAANFVFDFTTAGGPPTPIHTIQGSGNSSPLTGQNLTTTGLVTLLRTGSNAGGGAANGFFLQAPDADADADPNTSEGIFVFTSTVPTVAVGDEVNVTGTVAEFNGLTEIGSVTNVSLIDTGNPLPTPITLDTTILDATAAPTQPQLEKFEAMRMTAATLKSVAPNDNFFDVFVVLGSVLRPMREPGIEISLTVPPDPTSGVPDCCVPRWDENPERLLLDTNGRAGAPNVAYTSNVTFTGVAGPLDFAFGQYRLIPDAAPSASSNMGAVPVPSPNAEEFTVAGFNIENFNNNATQRQKAALAIRDVIGLPDIIGTVEIFDLADLQALAVEIQAIAGVTYSAHLIEQDGISEDSDQDVGFLVKTSRVKVDGVTQERASETYINPLNGMPELLHDRPPLVLRAHIEPTGANLPVIVVVNHTRSFIDIEEDPGDGPRVRAKRKAQGESIAGLLQELQSNKPTTSVISVGDYNAYQFNDGYTDPVATIKGNPTIDEQVVVDESPDLVTPDFINLIDQLLPADQYSFIFEETPQALDHVFVNTVAHSRNTRITIARNNADFPESPAAAFATNEARPERCSDHDPVVAYFSLGAIQPQGSVIISEFRFRGPDQGLQEAPSGVLPVSSLNEFVEIYNNTNADITVSTTDGSSGWAVVSSNNFILFEIPNGTVIPARGHYLGTNILGYTLRHYGGSFAGRGDDTYSADIPDNGGVALFRTSNPLNFTLDERLDAVGYSDAEALYREGEGLPPDGPEFSPTVAEFSFFRDMRTAGGLPKDTGDNAVDFLGASVDGAGTGLGSRLGAPGPENLFSPINRNSTFSFALLDPAAGTAFPPNRVRKTCQIAEECLPNRSPFGTLSIRRTLTNNTGDQVTRLRFRVMDITTFPAVGTADLRPITSGDIVVMVDGSPVDVRGTQLEEPPDQPNGGGWNSSLNVGVIDLAQPLPSGQSVSVQFLVGVQQVGSFRIFLNVEALNEGSPVKPERSHSRR